MRTASMRRGAFLLVLALLLGACGKDGGRVPELQGGAPIVADSGVEGFALVLAGRGQHNGDPALELRFSQPLAAAQDFDAQLAVTDAEGAVVEGSWVLGSDAGQLLFPFVKSDAAYRVRIGEGLQAADGSAFATATEREIQTGPLPPTVAFASQGSVLPARDTRGLPVVSVNVAEVDVEFLRVKDSEVANFFVNFQRGGRRGGWELGENPWSGRTAITRLADPVYLNRFVLGGGDNERRLSYLPVQNIAELQQPGLYFALMRRVGDYDSEYDTAFFFVSDLGLHVRAYREQILVHVGSLKDGSDVSDVALSVIDREGRERVTATTDGNGNALVAYALDAGHVLVARRGSDVSLLPFNQPALDLSEFAVAGRAQADFDVFAWSGRDLYRPGETLRLSALLRDHDGRPFAAQPLFASLKQPDGKVLVESRLESGEGGYYAWQYPVPGDAPTGRWQVEFRTTPGSGPVVQGMSLRIEEFLPERMKLELDAPERLRPGEPLSLDVAAAYLYGAPAAGNRFTARLALSADVHPLDALKDFHFGDPTVSLPKPGDDVIDAPLDAKGELQHMLALPEEVAKASTPVAVALTGSVFESGGRPVTRTLKRTLWPANALVGLRPLFDLKDGAPYGGNAGFELRRVDADGKSAPTDTLQVSLVRERRDYHWVLRNDSWDYDYTARFETVETRTLAARGDGGMRFDFPVDWGEYRIEVLDPATGLTTRLPFVAGWSWDNQNRGLDARPDKVKLALDKTAYRAGDTLEVTVTPPQPGRGVLMVETDRLLHIESFDAKPGARIKLSVGDDWERHDVYITTLVLRGGSALEKVTPARAVGVAHVPMDRSGRRITVAVEAPGEAQPERPLPVTVSAPALAGQTAWATVSAVDLGIINITRFPVPDAAQHFFAQRRLGIDAYDLYGRVIESFEGEVARLRFGGDMALGPLPQARRSTARVQTVDLYSGPVRLDAQGKAALELPVPDFNGTLRVSALVYSDERYGQGSSEAVLRAPILAEVSAPRVLAPGDRSTLTVDLQNFTGSAGEFALAIETEGPVSVAQATRRVSLDKDGKQSLRFVMTGREGAGVAQLRLTVEGGGQRLSRQFELTVRPAWPGTVSSRAQQLAPDGQLRLGSSELAGLMSDTATLRLTVSTHPPIPYARALQDLLAYPYGCVEQTTTRGFAALLLDAESAARMGITGLDDDSRRQRLEGALGRLAALQLENGHFAFWGGGDSAVPILTPYIAEFMLLARDAGFAVPETVLQKTLERLSEDLLSGGLPFYAYDQADHLRLAYQAHAGYVLATLNRAPLGTLRALWDNQRDKALSGLPLLHLGLALQAQGDAGRGAKAIAAALAHKDARPRWLGDYGSPLRDRAQMLALLQQHGQRPEGFDDQLLALSRELQARQGEHYWLSTQEQIALARLGKGLLTGGESRISGEWGLGDDSEPLPERRSFSRDVSAAELARGLRLHSTATAPLFVSVDVAGVPMRAPKADDSAVSVQRRWFHPDGKPWQGGPLREGQSLVAALRVESRETMPDALLVDLLPAGLEIENLNLSDPAQWSDVVIEGVTLSERGDAAQIQHEEYRDDRFLAALKLHAGQPAQLFYLVRAVTPGTYVAPPPQVEDMYRPMLRGVGEPRPASITVVEP